MLKPYPLSAGRIDDASLAEDKKTCRKIGPCGIGRHALYLNSFFIDRRYYVPFSMVTRVYKRVAMSKGGFSGKGVFASMAYLVVEYDGGKQKQCNFKDERDVDKLLEVLAKEQPQIRLLSAAGEQVLQKKEAEKAARKLPELSDDAKHTVTVLRRAKEYLDAKPELSNELSAAQPGAAALPAAPAGHPRPAGLRPVRGVHPHRQLRRVLCAVRLCRHLPVFQLQYAAHCPQ